MKLAALILMSALLSPALATAGECGNPPAFTREQADALPAWGGAAAFRQTAARAGAAFDFAAYKADCPNWAAFGYGLYYGRGCMGGVDVISEYVSYLVTLETMAAREPQKFQEYFWTEATRRGYTKYLTPVRSEAVSY